MFLEAFLAGYICKEAGGPLSAAELEAARKDWSLFEGFNPYIKDDGSGNPTIGTGIKSLDDPYIKAKYSKQLPLWKNKQLAITPEEDIDIVNNFIQNSARSMRKKFSLLSRYPKSLQQQLELKNIRGDLIGPRTSYMLQQSPPDFNDLLMENFKYKYNPKQEGLLKRSAYEAYKGGEGNAYIPLVNKAKQLYQDIITKKREPAHSQAELDNIYNEFQTELNRIRSNVGK